MLFVTSILYKPGTLIKQDQVNTQFPSILGLLGFIISLQIWLQNGIITLYSSRDICRVTQIMSLLKIYKLLITYCIPSIVARLKFIFA